MLIESKVVDANDYNNDDADGHDVMLEHETCAMSKALTPAMKMGGKSCG